MFGLHSKVYWRLYAGLSRRTREGQAGNGTNWLQFRMRGALRALP